jgi:hypothetical protein
MNKFVLAIALVTAFSAPASAALEKTPTLTHRHVESTFKHQWKGAEGQPAHDPYYYHPCNSTWYSYIVNDCD